MLKKLLLLFLLAPSILGAQSLMDPISYANAADVSNGIGIHISGLDEANPNTWADINKMGAKIVRFTCDWAQEEAQSAPPQNVSQGLSLEKNCKAAFQYAAQYHMRVIVQTSYFPPMHPVAYVEMGNQTINAGDITVPVTLISGVNGFTLNNLKPDMEYTLCDQGLGDDGQTVGVNKSCFDVTGGSAIFKNTVYGGKYSPGSFITAITNQSDTAATLGLSRAALQSVSKPPVSSATCSYTGNSTQIVCPAGTFPTSGWANLRLEMAGAQRPCGTGAIRYSRITSVSSDGSTVGVTGIPYCTDTGTVTIRREFFINEVLYTAQTGDKTDSFSKGVANYVQLIANYGSSLGVTGYVEIMNEPGSGFPAAWLPNGNFDHPFRNGYASTTNYGQYEAVSENGTVYASLQANNLNHDPATSPTWWTTTIPSNTNPNPTLNYGQNWGMLAATQDSPTLPTGWCASSPWVWNNGSYTLLNGSSTTGILGGGSAMLQPAGNVCAEVIHPYAGGFGTPEYALSINPTLDAAIQSNASVYKTHMAGNSGSSNIQNEFFLNRQAKLNNPANGVDLLLTETGIQLTDPAYRERMGNFYLRQQLGYSAGLGAKAMVSFQYFSESADNVNQSAAPVSANFSFVSMTAIQNGSVYAHYPQWTALNNLSTALAPISNAPLTYAQSDLASISSSGSTYPLMCEHMVGTRPGATANSDLIACYQRSFPAIFNASASNGVMTVTSIVNAPGSGAGPTSLQGTIFPGTDLDSGDSHSSPACSIVSQTQADSNGNYGGVGQYQMSPSTCSFGSLTNLTTNWLSNPAPQASTFTVTPPSGTAITRSVNLVTGASVSCTTANGSSTCPVSDEPIALMVDPANAVVLPPIIPCIIGIFCGAAGIIGR